MAGLKHAEQSGRPPQFQLIGTCRQGGIPVPRQISERMQDIYWTCSVLSECSLP